MRQSLRLGHLAGINVGIHWSIGLIAAILTVSLAGTILPGSAPGYAGAAYFVAAVATTGLFLASIVAHELGHSVVAQNNGIGVKSITLFALGGVATLESEPKTPGVAAKIALAGPAVSVAVGVAALLTAAAAGFIGASPLAITGLVWLGVVNLVLAVFNMLPAFPLDGGRVLQAALWKRQGDQHRATISAATVGRYLGWGLVFLGLWQFTQGAAGLWTAFIGIFVIGTARAEEIRARMLRSRDRFFGPDGPGGPGGLGGFEGPTGFGGHDPMGRYGDHRRYPGPGPETGRDDTVIDVESREVGTPGVR